MVRAAALSIFLFAWAVMPHAASQNPAADPRQLDTFLAELQRASQAGDRQAVAALIHYPIVIMIGGLRVPFADAGGFLERYDDIFVPALRQSIARGSTDVVIETANGQPRITAITVPRDAGGGSTAEIAPTELSRGAVGTTGPRRVAIRVGLRPTRIPGLLARDATDSLILFLPKGRLASVRLERVPPGEAVIRVVHARTGAPLGARVSANGRFVSGRPPEGADYRIEVRRTGNEDDDYLPYMLALSLR